jgi:single-stranded-DNA-specific exonuclease
LSRYCWQLAPVIPSPHLAQFKDFSPLLAQLLYNRGITEPVQFEPFLAADERLAGDPFLLSGMAEAVPRVIRALLKGELIAVYGDFDADGVTATAILTQGLSLLGNKAIPYIPHRVAEGHGLRHAALSELRQRGVSLVITVDCGVTAFAEVEGAQNEGLDIIITDHHALVSSLPPALAVINPKRDNSAYPFSGLAGVGVAFKLLQALFRASGKERRLDEFLDLVALGTVTDLVPLLGENRYLVKKGLETLNATSRPGLRELVLCAGLGLGNLDTENISYMLGPRLNAPGRLEHAFLSYELLVTTSSERGRQLAALLEEKNAERQRLTSHVLSKAKEELSPVDPDVPLLMVGGQDFPPGVIGVVAGKLVDEFYRPAVVLELGAEVSRGSCRSIPEFDITAALTQCCELLSHFGGHARAAGFTLPSNNVAALKRKLLEIARRELAGIHFRSTLAIDAEIPLSELSAETFKLVKMLAPFGQDNPAPTFLSHRVRVADWRCLGSKGEHLKLKLRDGDVVWDAIGFDIGHLSPDITPYLDIVYNLGEERWGGAELLRLNILDLLPVS